jgi:hypothetical protein
MSKSEKKPSQSEAGKKSVEKIPQKSRSKGKTPKQIMSRHIKDEKDVITEEEFKNLNIGIENSADTEHKPLDIESDPDRPKDEDKDPKVVTPWDVIN